MKDCCVRCLIGKECKRNYGVGNAPCAYKNVAAQSTELAERWIKEKGEIGLRVDGVYAFVKWAKNECRAIHQEEN